MSEERETQVMRGRPVTDEEADKSLERLFNTMFGQKPRAVASIPVRAEDDDILLTDYIRELRAQLAEALSQRQAAGVFLQHVSDVVFAYDGTKTDDKDVLVTALWDLRAQRQAAVEERDMARLGRKQTEAKYDEYERAVVAGQAEDQAAYETARAREKAAVEEAERLEEQIATMNVDWVVSYESQRERADKAERELAAANQDAAELYRCLNQWVNGRGDLHQLFQPARLPAYPTVLV